MPIAIEGIVTKVAHFYQCSEQSIYQAQRDRDNRNLPRWMAMKLCQDYSGQSLVTIAKRFGVGNYCTVSQTIARLRQYAEEDGQVKEQLMTITKDLTP